MWDGGTRGSWARFYRQKLWGGAAGRSTSTGSSGLFKTWSLPRPWAAGDACVGGGRAKSQGPAGFTGFASRAGATVALRQFGHGPGEFRAQSIRTERFCSSIVQLRSARRRCW